MIGNNEVTIAGNQFEDLKQINEHDAEYWSARAIQAQPGYSQWRRFESAIQRAISSCKESGNPPDHHFAGAGKPITGGKGALDSVAPHHCSLWITTDDNKAHYEEMLMVYRENDCDFTDALLGFLNQDYGYDTASFDRASSKNLGSKLLQDADEPMPSPWMHSARQH